jgi:hypothetical protein
MGYLRAEAEGLEMQAEWRERRRRGFVQSGLNVHESPRAGIFHGLLEFAGGKGQLRSE